MIGTGKVITLAAFAASLAACSSGPASSGGVATAAPSGEWKVARLGERPVDGPTLQFADGGSASGSTGCNRFSTTVTTDDRGGLGFGATAVTKMACLDGDRMAVESRFLDALSATRRLRHDGGRLLLLDADDKVVIELDPASGQP